MEIKIEIMNEMKKWRNNFTPAPIIEEFGSPESQFEFRENKLEKKRVDTQ